MAQMANINTATTAIGQLLDWAVRFLRHKTCLHDNTNVGEIEAQSWQIALMVAPARDVSIYIPERRETKKPDVHLTDI